MTVHHGRARTSDVDMLREVFASGRAIAKDEARSRYGIGPRQFRAAVSELRTQGVPIVSFSAEGSTYRFARSQEELDAFIEQELVSRSRVLEQQIRALRESSSRYFGVSEQLALISQGRR